MSTPGKQIGEMANQSARKVLIEKQLHPPITASRRSRSAAKAKHARTSSSVSSGKSAKISGMLIPPARYSSTSITVIRMPLMDGLPLRFPGSIVIMWR